VIHAAGEDTDHEHSRPEATTRLPLPPLAGNADGVGVASTAHFAEEGATFVLVSVEPHPIDAVTARIVRSARRAIREGSYPYHAHEYEHQLVTPVAAGAAHIEA